MHSITHNTILQLCIDGLKELPALPTNAIAALQSLSDEHWSANAVARIIECDPTLTSKVLALANSPVYGYSQRIATIELAIVVMGSKVVREIISTILLSGINSAISSQRFNSAEFWKYSLFSATTTKLLAKKCGYRLSGEAFIAGLIHDLGLLILAKTLPKTFDHLHEEFSAITHGWTECELAMLSTTHAEIGAEIMRKWNFPPHVVEAVEYHHSVPEVDGELSHILSLTEWFASKLGFTQWLHMPPTTLNEDNQHLLEQVLASYPLPFPQALEILENEILEEFLTIQISL